MKKNFYFIKSVRAWINIMHVVSVFRANTEWTISLVNGVKYNVSDDEYLELIKCFSHEEDKKKDLEELIAKIHKKD